MGGLEVERGEFDGEERKGDASKADLNVRELSSSMVDAPDDPPEESELTPDSLKVTSFSEEDSDEPRVAVLGFSSWSWWCPESLVGAEFGIILDVRVRL